MTFEESLKTLGIEDYSDRIFNSNSHGELFHLVDYIWLAEHFSAKDLLFHEWFEIIVKSAEQNWKRPESVFQHIPRLLEEMLTKVKEARDKQT